MWQEQLLSGNSCHRGGVARCSFGASRLLVSRPALPPHTLQPISLFAALAPRRMRSGAIQLLPARVQCQSPRNARHHVGAHRQHNPRLHSGADRVPAGASDCPSVLGCAPLPRECRSGRLRPPAFPGAACGAIAFCPTPHQVHLATASLQSESDADRHRCRNL